MQHPRKAAAPPHKGEARNHGNGAGSSSKQSRRTNDSHQAKKGKAIDSRTQVIEQAKRVTIGVPFHVTAPGVAVALMTIRDSMPGSSAIAQEARLEKALRRWSLTTFEMSRWLDLYDPRARIQGLRLAGHQILRTWVVIETDCGQRHRVGRFALQRGTTAPAPRRAGLPTGSVAVATDASEVSA
jgi:Helix-turn-helix domain